MKPTILVVALLVAGCGTTAPATQPTAVATPVPRASETIASSAAVPPSASTLSGRILFLRKVNDEIAYFSIRDRGIARHVSRETPADDRPAGTARPAGSSVNTHAKRSEGDPRDA